MQVAKSPPTYADDESEILIAVYEQPHMQWTHTHSPAGADCRSGGLDTSYETGPFGRHSFTHSVDSNIDFPRVYCVPHPAVCRPRLRIKLLPELDRGESVFECCDSATLRFHMVNVGHWYSKPAATNIRLYINFDPQCELVEARYGSTLERTERMVRWGKGYTRYFRIVGIDLSYGEFGEDAEVDVRMPAKPGTYNCHISAFSQEGECGVHRFTFDVVEKTA